MAEQKKQPDRQELPTFERNLFGEVMVFLQQIKTRLRETSLDAKQQRMVMDQAASLILTQCEDIRANKNFNLSKHLESVSEQINRFIDELSGSEEEVVPRYVKETAMAKRKKKTTPASKFQVGDKVRVKQGVVDTEYPDIPLGGWAGKIVEVHKNGLYTVEWSQEMLAAMPTIYKKRCEKDYLEIEQYWLRSDDLISDPGGPLEIQQPSNVVTKPLNLKDEEDRIRAVFRLTSDDPLPEVDFDTLEIYRDYLAGNLAFPFEAVLETESGPFSSRREKVTVTGLGEPDEDYRIDDTYGLICEIKIGKQRGDAPLGELEAKKGDRNRQLLSDYSVWFGNNR